MITYWTIYQKLSGANHYFSLISDRCVHFFLGKIVGWSCLKVWWPRSVIGGQSQSQNENTTTRRKNTTAKRKYTTTKTNVYFLQLRFSFCGCVFLFVVFFSFCGCFLFSVVFLFCSHVFLIAIVFCDLLLYFTFCGCVFILWLWLAL